MTAELRQTHQNSSGWSLYTAGVTILIALAAILPSLLGLGLLPPIVEEALKLIRRLTGQQR